MDRDWLQKTGNIAGVSGENLLINYSYKRPLVTATMLALCELSKFTLRFF